MEKAANFKVFQASAGAGKTFTLIKEYLKLCLKDEGSVANFRNILAITFTNAAANEMKAKIVNALCEIIDSKEKNRLQKKNGGFCGYDWMCTSVWKNHVDIHMDKIIHEK